MDEWLLLNPDGWDMVLFSKYKKMEEELDDFYKSTTTIPDGVITCDRCKSKRVFYTMTQTRSSDEPMTTVCFCTDCKKKWSQNC